MRIKMCHAQCEGCGHADVQDLDLEIHQSPDGQFSLAAVCRDSEICRSLQAEQRTGEVARAS